MDEKGMRHPWRITTEENVYEATKRGNGDLTECGRVWATGADIFHHASAYVT